jgi:hypothetical protein
MHGEIVKFPKIVLFPTYFPTHISLTVKINQLNINKLNSQK